MIVCAVTVPAVTPAIHTLALVGVGPANTPVLNPGNCTYLARGSTLITVGQVMSSRCGTTKIGEVRFEYAIPVESSGTTDVSAKAGS